jgi:hypothetical protein
MGADHLPSTWAMLGRFKSTFFPLFAESIHNRPVLEQLTEPKDERLGSELHAPRQDYFACQQQGAEVVVCASKLHHGWNHFVRCNLPSV